ncbi:MAG: Chromosome partition protein smc [Parcubacteria group bacterium Greene0416_79]|nr:MAG: Chromosome partition protein smc [Parcubacteria group bacterium Greene0416_79]
MYLKSLELGGFKSFAKKTVLDFNTPITAIVGPNGSGKSNIAEAFSFVLGEQSIKSMRGKRTEDLIWNGSPELARANRASVKLHFDNRSKLLNVDFDEAVLERVIYRDASSEYLLNGSQVRLRDIVELLSGAHIGASGHHIISQGEADRILNASMRERREMIEDALGLKIYQWKREESERKLLKSEENMKQVVSLRKEIAPHLSFLRKQMEKIEKVKAQKDELRALYREYLAREHRFLSDMRVRLASKAEAPRRELAELERSLSAAKKELQSASGRDEKTHSVLAIQEKIAAVRRERETLSRDIGRLEGEIAARERLAGAEASASAGEALVPLAEVMKISREVDAALAHTEVGLLRQAVLKIQKILSVLAERFRLKKEPTAEEAEREIAALAEKKRGTEKKLASAEAAEQEISEAERALRAEIEKAKDASCNTEKDWLRIMARQNELHGAMNMIKVEQAELLHREGDFKRELTEGALLAGREILQYERALLLPSEGDERGMQEERRRKIERLKIRIEDAGAGGETDLLKEFEEATERDAFLARELADLTRGGETLRALIAELEQKLDEEFRGGIEKINEEFQKFFSLMFGGGSAKLTVLKPERAVRRETDEALLELGGIDREELAEAPPTEAGIDIEVHLPRKKIKGLMMLSGGERALTSIALLFAMSQVKPPPFIVLDETDAALDEANSKKYGDMVENLSKHSQLILITHNRETMSRAGVIYGVTMDRTGVISHFGKEDHPVIFKKRKRPRVVRGRAESSLALRKSECGSSAYFHKLLCSKRVADALKI